MIILNVSLNGIYGFDNFSINFSYPKKIVNSIIDDEHLVNRPRFRYKKAVILMGANATGKTSLGKALIRIFRFLKDENTAPLFEMLTKEKGTFCIDFVCDDYELHRLTVKLNSRTHEIKIDYKKSEINEMDSYEMCVAKLMECPFKIDSFRNISYRFAYPEIEKSIKLSQLDKSILLKTLKAVIGTLDPTLQNVKVSKDLKDTFIIKRKNTEIIIQEGKLLNRDVLSSGTVEGIDVSLFLASMMNSNNTFYYCDEHFSYIQSDIEKKIFGIMLDYIGKNEQLIFTTHNTDMLDLNMPKHSYMFLRKQLENNRYNVTSISASEILKRNTDSIRSAVENDVFNTMPDDSLLNELEKGWKNG